MKCFQQLVSQAPSNANLLIVKMLTAKKLPKVDPAGSRQGTATGQRGSAGGRVIDVTHEESSSQGGCCKN